MATLYKIKIHTEDDSNIFTLTPDALSSERGAKPFAVKATKDMIQNFLVKTEPGDNVEMCRSKRFVSFEDMVSFILSGVNNDFWFWAHKYPKTLEDFQSLLEV